MRKKKRCDFCDDPPVTKSLCRRHAEAILRVLICEGIVKREQVSLPWDPHSNSGLRMNAGKAMAAAAGASSLVDCRGDYELPPDQ